MGEIRLPAPLGDGMVLQRETENEIWGDAKPGSEIFLSMGTYKTETKTGENGKFTLKLPAMQAGGPWEIRLYDGETETVIRDVLFGDVFLLGGQSNMELPLARVTERFGGEIRNTAEPGIRMFEVPKEYCFGKLREELSGGRWMKAAGEDLLLFSAAGYFAAKELYDKERIPIGLLQTAVGGTPVKAWCKEETVQKLGYDAAELAECRQEGYARSVEEKEAQRAEIWWREALAGNDKRSGTIELPGFFSGTALEGFCGAVALRKKFELPENSCLAGNGAKLYLGALIDADFTYVNERKAGETAYRYPPRIYELPEGMLHAGENEIEIKMLVFNGGGGFMPGKRYEICDMDGKNAVTLSGEWEYEIITEMQELPETTFFQYKASGLYQGMLYPLRRWKLKGCFFYQGESNTGRPETYEEEFTALIADWRALWKEQELPFIFVQLAGFSDGIEHTDGTDWARLREAQRLTAEHVKNTLMVQAYDLGEYNDLHPLDKKSVGCRIALAAEWLIYGKNVVCRGAHIKEVTRLPGKAKVLFAPEETVLRVKANVARENGAARQDANVTRENGAARQSEEDGMEVCGFAWQGADGSRRSAAARLVGNAAVEILLPEEATGISYAWNDCPSDANLYNEQGLPVVPFEVIFK